MWKPPLPKAPPPAELLGGTLPSGMVTSGNCALYRVSSSIVLFKGFKRIPPPSNEGGNKNEDDSVNLLAPPQPTSKESSVGSLLKYKKKLTVTKQPTLPVTSSVALLKEDDENELPPIECAPSRAKSMKAFFQPRTVLTSTTVMSAPTLVPKKPLIEDKNYRDQTLPSVQNEESLEQVSLMPHGESISNQFPLQQFCGLDNLGNTCYFNSVLQVLRFIPSFTAHLESVFRQAVCKPKIDISWSNYTSRAGLQFQRQQLKGGSSDCAP